MIDAVKNSLLDTEEWKIDHRGDGSFIAFPYKYNNKIKHGWTLGPMDRHVAEWLFDAIQNKRK